VASFQGYVQIRGSSLLQYRSSQGRVPPCLKISLLVMKAEDKIRDHHLSSELLLPKGTHCIIHPFNKPCSAPARDACHMSGFTEVKNTPQNKNQKLCSSFFQKDTVSSTPSPTPGVMSGVTEVKNTPLKPISRKLPIIYKSKGPVLTMQDQRRLGGVTQVNSNILDLISLYCMKDCTLWCKILMFHCHSSYQVALELKEVQITIHGVELPLTLSFLEV